LAFQSIDVAHQAHRTMAARHQLANDGPADEAGSPGDKHAR
jgi:hypothetical protein